MKKIFVTGSAGLVGSRFLELAKDKFEIVSPEIDSLDITDKEEVFRFFQNNNIDTIVNFAAYTDVSQAENQRGDRAGDCWKVNVEGVRNLVSGIDPQKTHFIHISTDYVFPGSDVDKGPYSEDHSPMENENKVTWYGFTKAEGERVIKKILGEKATILRIIYPVRAKYDKKLDYLRKPLSLYDQGKLYPMFSDQQVSITFIDEAVKALEKIIESGYKGIFHAASSDTSTPYELVSYLLEKARGVKDAVKPSKLADFISQTKSSPIRYPQYGGLKVEKTGKNLGIKFSSWREIIEALVVQGIGD